MLLAHLSGLHSIVSKGLRTQVYSLNLLLTGQLAHKIPPHFRLVDRGSSLSV
ncbi:hypothetical protein SLEP1_g58104 [Rubroshorea leprosula]|uniref:Uncharacterized protein n=1 Tax=Rubroshorea leprosula TaxID=152421 RepID=A0AAV5MSS5_9ROSI|nr:hypothetical protein SLEP1_g58104 [Rubroshorea leprosula]